MTILIPDTIRECSLEWEYLFLTEFASIIDSCFMQYNAPFVDYVNVAQ